MCPTIYEMALDGEATGSASGAPSPSGSIRYDTRSGGAQSIQAAGTLAAALSASGMTEWASANGGNLDWATDVDGTGAHAFRMDWPGVAALTQVETGVYRSMNGLGITTGDIYVQWKIWQTKTASGGGIGTAGDWDAYSQGSGSGKRLVWFSNSGSNEGRWTFAPGDDADSYLGQFFVQDTPRSNPYNPTKASVGVNWDSYVSQWITFTMRIVPETGAGAGDGTLEAWFNGTLIRSTIGTATTTQYRPDGQLEIGGPTWIGVPQDQTMYVKDIVVWQP